MLDILDSARYCIFAQNKIMGLLEEIIFYDVTALLSTLTWELSDFCLGTFLFVHSCMCTRNMDISK